MIKSAQTLGLVYTQDASTGRLIVVEREREKEKTKEAEKERDREKNYPPPTPIVLVRHQRLKSIVIHGWTTQHTPLRHGDPASTKTAPHGRLEWPATWPQSVTQLTKPDIVNSINYA